MSIIQEALRKAQKNTVRNKPAQDNETMETEEILKSVNSVPKRSGSARGVYYAAAIIILAILAATLLTATRHRKAPVRKNSAADVSVNSKINIPNPEIGQPEEAQKPTAVQQPKLVPQQAAAQEGDFVLSGIMHLEDGPQAIINNSTVVEGDEVSGASVEKITDTSVTLKKDGSEIMLYLK